MGEVDPQNLSEGYPVLAGSNSPKSSWYWKKILQVQDKMVGGYNQNRWRRTKSGTYTIANGYKWLMGQKHDFLVAKIIWSRYNVPKYSFCLWKVCVGKLPTCDLLMKWNQQQRAPWCVLCHEQLETQTHLFYLCQFSQSVLQNVLSAMRMPGLIIENQHIKRVWKKLKSDTNRKVLSLCIAGITYHL